jgi:hypothetical protein
VLGWALEVVAWHVVIRPELSRLSGPAAHAHTPILCEKVGRAEETRERRYMEDNGGNIGDPTSKVERRKPKGGCA